MFCFVLLFKTGFLCSIWKRFILTSKCPALSCLVSNQLFFTKLFCLPSASEFYLFLFLYIFLYFLLYDLLCSWVAGPWSPPFLLFPPRSLILSSHISPPIYPFCLPAMPILSPALLLAVQLFIRQIRCFRQAK